jgi:hypothetical protein
MKRSMLVLVVLACILTCGIAAAQDQPAPAPAAPHTPRVTKRQINQQERIQQGVNSGELTKGETRILKKEQVKIQKDKKAAKADGTVTPQERRKLLREQNKASRDIHRLKHNELEKK